MAQHIWLQIIKNNNRFLDYPWNFADIYNKLDNISNFKKLSKINIYWDTEFSYCSWIELIKELEDSWLYLENLKIFIDDNFDKDDKLFFIWD